MIKIQSCGGRQVGRQSDGSERSAASVRMKKTSSAKENKFTNENIFKKLIFLDLLVDIFSHQPLIELLM